jgi:hypothetical protein
LEHANAIANALKSEKTNLIIATVAAFIGGLVLAKFF